MIRIKNWGEFQHFKDRTPPWIKLYRNILDDPNWHELSGECAKTLTMLWLIASEDKNHEGYLPDIKTISFRLRQSEQKTRAHLAQLNHWLIDDDISVISERYQLDTPETETEKRQSKNRGTRFALTQCPEDWINFCNHERPDLNPQKVFDYFRDYWIGVAGAKGVKLDWFSTWRNWVRNQKHENNAAINGINNKPSKTERARAAILESAREIGYTHGKPEFEA